MGVWDTSVGGQLVVGSLPSPQSWGSFEGLEAEQSKIFTPPSNQQRVYRYKNGWLENQIHFLFGAQKAYFAGAKLSLLVLGRLMTWQIWRFQHYLFWDPYNFSSQKPISGLNWWGDENERCENSLCFFIVWYLFFEIWGKLVGVFWKFEGLNAALPPVVFFKGKQHDVRKVFVLVSQALFFLQSSSKYQT